MRADCTGGCPVSSGQDSFELYLRCLGDAGEHVGEPDLGIDIVELGGAGQGVHGGRAHAAAVRSGDGITC